MNWIIIVVLIVLAFIFLRFRHFKHKVFLVFLILVLLFFYVTASRVLSGYDINLKSVAGTEKAIRVYFTWLGEALGNFKVLTANAIKMDWTAKNKTDETIKVIENKEK